VIDYISYGLTLKSRRVILYTEKVGRGGKTISAVLKRNKKQAAKSWLLFSRYNTHLLFLSYI